MIRLIEISFLLLFALSSNAEASGTSVGNGGDPVFYFLESTRYSLRQTLEYLVNHSDDANKFCESVRNLTHEQRKDCGIFTRQTLTQILQLNSPQDPTEFVLRDDVLTVEGPDGIPMPVSARTQLGRSGPIEFHRFSIQFLSPAQMLSLMAHEFGHKTEFSGINIEDNIPVMNFRRGRDLLDAFGSAVSHLATQKGFIGTSFGLRDLFDCRVDSNAGKFRVRVSSPRKFMGTDYNRYEITMGHTPSDPRIEVPELDGTTLLLRMRISESRPCLESNAERKSILEIIRLFPDNARTEAVVAREEFSAINPVCGHQQIRPLAIEAAGFRFSCLHVGSEGVTTTFRKYSLQFGSGLFQTADQPPARGRITSCTGGSPCPNCGPPARK